MEESSTTHLRLLGRAAVVTPGTAVEHVLERKDAALLAKLVLDGPTARSRLAAMLWPDASTPVARGNLRQRLFRLRATIGCDIVKADAGTTLCLADGVTSDVAQILQRLREDPQAGRGELLEGHDYDNQDQLGQWVHAAREGWRAYCNEGLAQLASDHEQRQEIAAALAYAQRIVADAPLLEHAHRRVMRLHYLRGDRAAALAAFDRCTESIGRELGLRPAAETVELARLIEASGALTAMAPSARPVTTLRPPHLVGREAEWREIQQALQRGLTVLVLAEPGIGKTRLLQEFAAAQDSAILAGARPGDERVAHASMARLLSVGMRRFGTPDSGWVRTELSQLLPALGAAPDGALQPLRLRQALAHTFDAWHAAGLSLVGLDDVQFADAATLELLPSLASSDCGSRWLLAARAAEVPALLAGWIASGAVMPVRLPALDASAVALLLDSLAIQDLASAAWAGPLTRHTGGNPFFLLETLNAIGSRDASAFRQRPAKLPLPTQVGALIEHRLVQLSPAALRLARVAALAGQDFSADVAASVLQAPLLDIAQSWRELEQALVIGNQGFTHDLIRETTLRTVPATLAREQHGQLAALLERHGAEPARVAQHWFDAGQWALAGACFLRAAQRANKASHSRLEAELAARAAECFVGAADSAGHFAAREHHLRASRYSDPLSLQIRNAEQLMHLATTADQRGAALEAYAAILIEDFRDEAIRAAANEARLIAASGGNAARELAAAPIEARALSRMNRIDEALQLVAQYLPGARELADTPSGARLLAEFGCVLMTSDRVAEAEPLFRAALATAQLHRDWALTQDCHQHMAWVHDYRGDIVRSARSYEAARELGPRLGSEWLRSPLGNAILARRYKELGRYDEALALLDQVLREQRRPEVAVVAVAEAEQAGVYLWLGQPERALQALHVPAADAPAAMQRCYRIVRAQVEAALNRPALALLDEATRFAAQEGGAAARLVIDYERCSQLDPGAAASVALDALSKATALGLELLAWPLRLAACDALRRAGRVDEAASHAHECAAHFDRCPPAVVYAPQTWWTVHRVLAAAGDGAAAYAALERARTWIHDVALPHVPAEFRGSFLQRNPVNRAVLAVTHRTLRHGAPKI